MEGPFGPSFFVHLLAPNDCYVQFKEQAESPAIRSVSRLAVMNLLVERWKSNSIHINKEAHHEPSTSSGSVRNARCG
jgi:hypothetical protein